jgi:hypothetical protein
MRPAALAAFSHVVTVQKELRRQRRYLRSILDLKLRLHCTGESDSIARTAGLLVANLASEVVAVEIPPVVLLGNFRVRDLFGAAVLVPEGLGLFKDLIPVFTRTDVFLLGCGSRFFLLLISFG